MGLRTKLIYVVVPLLVLMGAIVVAGFVGSSEDNTQLKTMGEQFSTVSLDAPTDLNFAGEPVPMTDFEVKERFENQLIKNIYFHSATIMILKRAGRYEKEITDILRKEGVPEDFFYLLVAESALTNATSPAGAKGFWQFMEETAKNYDLRVDGEVDERLDYLKSTYAACRYLKDAYKRLNNWTLVAASYNMGVGGVESQLARQKVTNYYDLYLNAETSAYVFRVLAIKTILRNPRAYGFHLRKDQIYLPLPTQRVKVDTSIEDMVAFAQAHGTTYKMLKVLNPWMLGDVLTVKKGESFFLSVAPEGSQVNAGELIPHAAGTPADTVHADSQALNTGKSPQ